jgi:2-hydroxychromene-2-carboxylate isomerase
MRKTLIYFHSLSSPWTYLGGPRLHALIKKHDLEVVLRPTSVVGENGGIRLRTRPDNRQAYHEVELDRWRKFLNMPLVLRPKYYPSDPQFSTRMVIATDTLGWDALNLSHALLHALWSEERDIRDRAVRQSVADRMGLDGGRLVAMEDTPAIMERWHAIHQEALDAGIFGSPTYVFDNELFWGQDRLEFLDRRLSEL